MSSFDAGVRNLMAQPGRCLEGDSKKLPASDDAVGRGGCIWRPNLHRTTPAALVIQGGGIAASDGRCPAHHKQSVPDLPVPRFIVHDDQEGGV